jgi:hypothetical protein
MMVDRGQCQIMTKGKMHPVANMSRRRLTPVEKAPKKIKPVAKYSKSQEDTNMASNHLGPGCERATMSCLGEISEIQYIEA